jgi:hypothetical protein
MKQETLEEVAEKESEAQGWGKYDSNSEQYAIKQSFINGAKWQAERSYNEDEVDLLVNELINKFTNWSGSYVYRDKLIEIYEQFKKK